MRTFVKIQKYSIFVLVTAAAVGLYTAFKLSNLPHIQLTILTIVIFFYLLWALVHHYLDKSLKFEIVIEYVLTALLALIILYGVLL